MAHLPLGGRPNHVCAAGAAGGWAAGLVSALAGAGEGAAGFERSVSTFWHWGQRTFREDLPRRTAKGTRMAEWHWLQTTRMESAGVFAGAGTAGRVAGGACGAGARRLRAS